MQEDRDRCEAFLTGDRAAVAQFDDWIRPVIRHRTWGLPEQEQDLLQEVRLRLLKELGAGSFRGQSALKTYVQSVAKYTCLDAVRWARVRRGHEPLREQIVAMTDQPDEQLERWDEARLCTMVLSGLSELCRDMLRMVFERRLRYEQIAAEMELSLGTVKSRLARCRDKAVTLRGELLEIRGEERGDST